MPQFVTVRRVGLTVERLLFRAHGRRGQTAALLAATLALNRDLPGPALPLGTVVILPDLPAAPAATTRPSVNLFDE